MHTRLIARCALFLWILGGILTNSPAQCVNPPSGLVAWWRAEGNAFDTRGANDGVLIGGVGFAEGKSGVGFVFSGAGDEYVQLPPEPFTFPNEGTAAAPFSFELWFRTSASGVILGQQDVTPFAIPDDGYVPALYVGTNGLLHAYMFWGLEDVIVTTNAVNDGNWHHVVVTYGSNLETLYLDGKPVAVMFGAQYGYSRDYQYQLGTAYTGGWPGTPGMWFPFEGMIDEVCLYNRALSAAEVSTLYGAGSAGKCVEPVLRQRYSFNEPAGSTLVPDSKRQSHGVILYSSPTPPHTNGVPDGTGFTGTGQLRLGGTSGYVQLPPYLASWLTKATFEVWVTWYGPATSTWQRIFDFGLSDRGLNASGTGTNYIVLCPSRGGTEVLGFEQTTVNPFGNVVDPNALVLGAPRQMPIGREVYVAVTYDPAMGSQLYIDGQLITSVLGKTLNPLKEIADLNCWLGRSQWQRDPHFNGQYNEFRIWDGILTAPEIANHYAGGPDQDLVPISSPFVTAFVAPDGIRLSWPESFSGFAVESSPHPTAGPWTQLTGQVSRANGFWEVRIPVSVADTFYRLRR